MDHNPVFAIIIGSFQLAFGAAMVSRFWPDTTALAIGGAIMLAGAWMNLMVAIECGRRVRP